MFVVRYLALAALVVWVGAMVVLGALVTPSMLRVLEAADPSTGRVLAGLVFSDILSQFHLLALVCGSVIFVSLWMMKFIGPPPSGFVVRSAIVATMLALTLYSGIPVWRELAQVQRQVSSPVRDIPETDARKVRFDGLQGRSTTMMTINIGLGFVLLLWYVSERTVWHA